MTAKASIKDHPKILGHNIGNNIINNNSNIIINNNNNIFTTFT